MVKSKLVGIPYFMAISFVKTPLMTLINISNLSTSSYIRHFVHLVKFECMITFRSVLGLQHTILQSN